MYNIVNKLMIYIVNIVMICMVNKTQCRLYKGKSSYTISLKKSLVDDTSFPFEAGDLLDVEFENDKVIISKH